MDQKTTAVIAIICVGALIAGGAFIMTSNAPDTEEKTRMIKDMSGRDVEIPEKVDRVICIGCTSLRYVTYLGCSDKVVGVEEFEKRQAPSVRSYSMAHKEYRDLPNIGPMDAGDKELILTVNPQLIFWTSYQDGDADDMYKSVGIPVVALTNKMNLVDKIDLFHKQLRLMGDILDAKERAEEIINYVETIKNDIGNRVKNLTDEEKSRTAYYCGMSSGGSHGITSTNAAYVPFAFTNIKNVVPPGTPRTVSVEFIVTANPQYLIVDANGNALVKNDYASFKDSLQKVDAIKNDRIYSVLPMVSYSSNWETALACAYYVGSVVYPDRFTDVDPVKKADEIYQFWLGVPLYGEISSVRGGFGKITLE